MVKKDLKAGSTMKSNDIGVPKSELQHIIYGMSNNTVSKISYRDSTGMHTIYYADLFVKAHKIANYLQSSGIDNGEIVAIHGETSLGWLVVDLACAIVGAVSLALYPNTDPSRVVRLIRECKVKLVFSDSEGFQEDLSQSGIQCISLKECSRRLNVRQIIDGETLREISYNAPLKREFTIVSTSGTLSQPRLFSVASNPLLRTIEEFVNRHNITGNDNILIFLPLSHLPQRMICYGFLKAQTNLTLSNPQFFSKDSINNCATITVTVPRVLEFCYKRKGDTCDKVFGKTMRLIFVGSAPTRPEVMQTLIDAGFPIYEVYGTTELGIIAMSYPGQRRVGYAGPRLPWVNIKTTEEKELLINTETPFLYGFMNNGLTEPFDYDKEKWISSGDLAELNGNFVRVVARVKDFIVLQSGEKIYVNHLEMQLSELLSDMLIVIVGNGGKNIKAMLFHEPSVKIDNLNIKRAIRMLNKSNHRLEAIKEYALFNNMPSAKEECMTDTMKIRRHAIEHRYNPIAKWMDA